MDFDWLSDWKFWAWLIPVVIGSFEIGVWWSGRDRAKVVAEREDQEYRKRNSAILRVRPGGFSDHGHILLGIRNVGDHPATAVQGMADFGTFQRSFDTGDMILLPQDGFPAQLFVGLESSPKIRDYSTQDMAHLPAKAILEVSYTDGLGPQCRRWEIFFQPKGDLFPQWDYRVRPLEE